MEKPWFDPKTGMLLFDEYVQERQSFQDIVADKVVSKAELMEQAWRVAGLLQDLEGLLSSEAKAVATDALCELSVLHALLALRHQAAKTGV